MVSGDTEVPVAHMWLWTSISESNLYSFYDSASSWSGVHTYHPILELTDNDAQREVLLDVATETVARPCLYEAKQHCTILSLTLSPAVSEWPARPYQKQVKAEKQAQEAAAGQDESTSGSLTQ